ncbi:hypothetical protein M885DRAFT_504559 [Pelagophyceae sp. CCMP2097]|nr:hypothetical protein M885DRAFT_504559 [Pelagophyceae sp. CCMP2097]|mmetsp:Transcript_27816/g.93531  ORF Transcript_27816/g.93531 Transcript_27816/m.93531 type:complete len:322 (-) Transcript_27816:245-1210(-)
MSAAKAQAFKKEGNDYFQKKQHEKAIEKYSEAIAADGTDVTFYSNRSAAYAALEMWDEAADDGRNCIRVQRDFIKGYFRLAVALRSAGKYKDAIDNIKTGLAIDPGNADLKKQAAEMEEIMRKDRIKALIVKAKQLLDDQQFGDCLASCEKGLQQDAGNVDLVKLKKLAAPKFEAQEKSRKKGLSQADMFKEEGDGKYKNADFEGAIASYTKCIDHSKKPSQDVLVKALSNRAACYKQLSDFDGTIEDCSRVLEAEPGNAKALVRRAQAFEAVERYKLALQDVKDCLQLPPPVVGESNWKLCNEMQHRLNRVINLQKSASY